MPKHTLEEATNRCNAWYAEAGPTEYQRIQKITDSLGHQGANDLRTRDPQALAAILADNPPENPAITLAGNHMERRGYTIVQTSAPTRWGTIDLIAHRKETIVFVTVKGRTSNGEPRITVTDLPAASAVTAVRKLAASWLAENPTRPKANDLRFDLIGVTYRPDGSLDSLDHLEGAA